MENTVNHSMTASDNAAKRIATLLEDEPKGTVFRVEVEGGGCSGFQYRFDLDSNGTQTDDFIIERDGAVIAIDYTSLELLSGAELHFSEQLVGSAFEIKNPNAASGCGCGNSFSLG